MKLRQAFAQVGVKCESPSRLEPARMLAVNLDLPFVEEAGQEKDFGYLLVITHDDQLELRSTKKGGPRGVRVDFGGGAVDYRRRYGGQGGQMILKAVGGPDQRVFDATAGLCGDAFILASYSCQVTAMESQIIVSALVKDGLRRGLEDPKTKYICERIHFRHGDSIQFLKSVKTFDHDVIYLDPMFPAKKKTALPKKELQVLHDLVGDPGDETQSRKLLRLARKACGRVVVKRHLRAPPLEEGAAVVFKGASTRFDVYLDAASAYPVKPS